MPQGMFYVHTHPPPAPDGDSIPPNRFSKRKRHPMKQGGVFIYWWSRAESNRRPQALYRPLYILSFHYLILTFHTPMGGLVESESP